MNGTAEKYLKWYTPVKGLLALILGVGIYMGGLEVRVSQAEKDAAEVQPVKEAVAEINGKLDIIIRSLPQPSASPSN